MVAATTLTDLPGEAFDRLFVAEYGRVVSIAYRITRDMSDAEDVAQEVFVRCAHSARTRARGWLYAAAVHTALNVIRSRRRRAAREVRRLSLERSLGAAAQRDRDPQNILEREDEAQFVRAAMLRLSKRDAEVLALRYGGLSYREIAQTINVDVGQIGTRLARAERALRREFQRETF